MRLITDDVSNFGTGEANTKLRELHCGVQTIGINHQTDNFASMNAFIARTSLAPRHVYRQVGRQRSVRFINEVTRLTPLLLQFAATTNRKMHIKSIPMCTFPSIHPASIELLSSLFGYTTVVVVTLSSS